MKKVQIVLPLNEKNLKEQNYGYMRPLKTRDKHIYKTHSKDWNKKKRNISLLACFYSCVRSASKWNNLSDPKTQRTMMGPGATELFAKKQMYFAQYMLGKIK